MGKKTKSLDLNKVIDVFEKGVPSTPHEIAEKLELEFSKGSPNRQRLADALDQLLTANMITQYGSRFVRMVDSHVPPEQTMVGVIKKNEFGHFFHPVDETKQKIEMTNSNLPDGTIVTVKPSDSGGYIERVLVEHGNIKDAYAPSLLSALEAGIPIEFPQKVLDETINLSVPKTSPDRRDYTHIPFLTIDPVTAKDFDDAICVRRKKGNWIVMVAVADVSHYVRPGTELFEEAYKRGNSTYLPGLTIPMLPEILSNGLCSLKPNEDRAAIVTTMEIDKHGDIVNHKMEKAVIRSRARLDYDQVQTAIDGLATGAVRSLYNKYIVKAKEACEVLLKEAARRGHLDLSVAEQRIDYSESSGFNLDEERNTLSHEIIASLMIANNRCAVRELESKGKTVISRAHGEPSERQYNKFVNDLLRLGIVPNEDLSLPERVRDMAVQSHGPTVRLGDRVRQMLVLMQDRARYVVGKVPHYGLALDDGYTHFTSPIRRFTDLIVHSLVTDADKKDKAFFIEENLKDAAKHLSKTERRSQDAERQAKKRSLALWLAGNMSKTFNARVVNVDETKGELELRGLTHAIHTYVTTDVSNYKKDQIVQMTPNKADVVTGVIEFSLVANMNGSQSASNDNKANQSSTREQSEIQERDKAPRMRKFRAAHYG